MRLITRSLFWLLIAIGLFIFSILILFFSIKFIYHKNYHIADRVSDYDHFLNKKGKGIGYYIINLDREKERMQNTKAYFDKLGVKYSRISGIDGNKMSEEEINKLIKRPAFYENLIELPTKGLVGCYISHLNAIKEFLKSDYEYGFIFEDDVGFDEKKLKIALQDVMKYSKKWDMVQFGIMGKYGVFEKYVKEKIHHFDNSNTDLYSYRIPNFSNFAYLINRKIAVEILARGLPIISTAEIFILIVSEKFNVVTFYPPIARQTIDIHSNNSNIASSDKIFKKDKKRSRNSIFSVLTDRLPGGIRYVSFAINGGYSRYKNEKYLKELFAKNEEEK